MSSPVQYRKILEFEKALTASANISGGRGWFSGRGQKSGGNNRAVVPISETERISSQRAKEFGKKNVEFGGFFRGTGPDRLDQLVLPNVMGVESSRREVLDDLIDLKGPTSTMLALDSFGNLGVQIFSSKYDMEKGFLEGRGKFIALEHLILNKPFAQFMSQQDRGEVFPGMDVQDISNQYLIDMIKQSRDKKSASYVVGEGKKIEEIVFEPRILEVDVFGTDRSYHPTNRFIKEFLKTCLFGLIC